MSSEQERLSDIAKFELISKASRVFSPAAPINRRDLFAGRLTQLQRVVEAIGTRGQHVVIFGDRGVGKTSLANIVLDVIQNSFDDADQGRVVKVNCSQEDNFASIWKKALSEITVIQDGGYSTLGFKAKPILEEYSAADALPEHPSPNDIRRVVTRFGTTIVILDEFDRISDGQGLFADTIKTLSDNSTDCTLVLVGVAKNIDELIAEHASVDRALIQILMPLMTTSELHEIVNKAMTAIGMTMESDARELIVLLSQGLPHYTHSLGKAATLHALNHGALNVSLEDVYASINSAIDNSQQSIRNAYHHATSSPRKDAIFKQVLLSCAITTTDDLGFFISSDVRGPLSKILRKQCAIGMFLGHLDKFASPDRGNVLEKQGTRRRYRFRFANPLLRPFVIIRGMADGLLRGKDLIKLLKENAGRST